MNPIEGLFDNAAAYFYGAHLNISLYAAPSHTHRLVRAMLKRIRMAEDKVL